MNPTELKNLVDQMPDPDGRGMYCENIDKDKIEKAVAEIQKGGREAVLGLIDMLVVPGKGDDVKPHYALHCVAVYTCKLEDKQQRREFSDELASQLGGDRPKAVQAYLCQELQVAGGKEVTPALGKLLNDEELCAPAAMALTAIGQGAAEQFRTALPAAKGKCRMTVVQNLGVLKDAQSVEALRQATGDEDRDTRILAGWGLANIGDAGSAEILLKKADGSEGWERIQAHKACLLLAERLAAADKKDDAKKIYGHLKATRSDPSERYIREAAEKGLAAVA
jgi:HEAT repeat protein